MTKEELRKIMIAIVASGFIAEYTPEGAAKRAIAIVDLIEDYEDGDKADVND